MPFSLTASSPDSLFALAPGASKRKSYEPKLVALWTFGGAGQTTISKLALGIIADGNGAVKPTLV
jgi:N-acetylglutamate synthase/N-acetylornithine aminotransferase